MCMKWTFVRIETEYFSIITIPDCMSGYWTALLSGFGEHQPPPTPVLVPSSHPLPFPQRPVRVRLCVAGATSQRGRKPLTTSSGTEFPVLLQVDL